MNRLIIITYFLIKINNYYLLDKEILKNG